ncbi:MAG: hypothetical protein GX298_11815 [Planctomycetes bacterium]|nr:hypothetical protein [Planctomycetota bacterium]
MFAESAAQTNRRRTVGQTKRRQGVEQTTDRQTLGRTNRRRTVGRTIRTTDGHSDRVCAGGRPYPSGHRSDRRRIDAQGRTWANFGGLAAIASVQRVRREKSAFLRQ